MAEFYCYDPECESQDDATKVEAVDPAAAAKGFCENLALEEFGDEGFIRVISVDGTVNVFAVTVETHYKIEDITKH